MKNLIELAFEKISKESEKAICLNVCVSYNGNMSTRDVWFPKSVCEIKDADYDKNGKRAFVADWFLRKAETANAFAGYDMRFETAFWN